MNKALLQTGDRTGGVGARQALFFTCVSGASDSDCCEERGVCCNCIDNEVFGGGGGDSDMYTELSPDIVSSVADADDGELLGTVSGEVLFSFPPVNDTDTGTILGETFVFSCL